MNSPHLFFDTFRRSVRIEGTLQCETALRIGAGKSFDSLNTRLPILRDAQGRPILPGASLKGVVRSQVESILRSINPAKVCDPLGPEACLGKERSGEDPAQKPAKRQTSSAKQAAIKQAEILQKTCWTCGIFGGPGLASHVLFADALPQRDILPERRDGVSIDRDLGRAADKRVFDFEVVPAGSTFRLRITLQDLEEPWEGAVVMGLDLLNEGFARVGGFKSRGLGLVSLQNMSVFIRSKDKLEGHSQAYDDFKNERLTALHAFLGKERAHA